jgi:hypothetical protein
MVQPASSLSIVSVADVLMLSGVSFTSPSCAESAMEKHAACAAAINSSGFVPGVFSNRVVNEYGVFDRTPLVDETVPFPSFSPPFQTALAFRCIAISCLENQEIKPVPIVEGERGILSLHCGQPPMKCGHASSVGRPHDTQGWRRTSHDVYRQKLAPRGRQHPCFLFHRRSETMDWSVSQACREVATEPLEARDNQEVAIQEHVAEISKYPSSSNRTRISCRQSFSGAHAIPPSRWERT